MFWAVLGALAVYDGLKSIRFSSGEGEREEVEIPEVEIPRCINGGAHAFGEFVTSKNFYKTRVRECSRCKLVEMRGACQGYAV